MQDVLIIIHAAPHGSERFTSALRLANALTGIDQPKARLRLYLMSDATVAGLPRQNDGAGNALQVMLERLLAEGVPIHLCRSCAQARGLVDLPLLPGIEIGNLGELAQWTLEADKVLTF